jgi:hypothetical protein
MIERAVLGSLVLCLAAGAAHGVERIYTPRDPEPTPEETLLLEYINRFRMDPAGEAARVKKDPGAHAERRQIDWELFARELAAEEPVAPVVMNLDLLLAARRHAYYLAVNDKRGHVEESELDGFTGVKMPERVVEAGYRWTAWRENVYAAPDPWSVHAGFVVDFSHKGEGGMLDGRGHRKALLRADVREAGTAAYAREKDFIYTEGLADRKELVRAVGGVVFIDRDGDNFYDIGEGVGGARVTASDGSKTKTWASGAYTLELQSTDAVKVTIEHQGHRHAEDLGAGRESVKLDLVIFP